MKRQVTLNMREELVDWVHTQVDGIVVRSFTHYIEMIVQQRMEEKNEKTN